MEAVRYDPILLPRYSHRMTIMQNHPIVGARCVTPTTEISDDEIPHLMNPNSSDIDDDDDDDDDDEYDEYDHDGQYSKCVGPCIPGDIDASPISSISSTRGERSVDTSGVSNLLPPVSFSSEDRSANSRGYRGGASRGTGSKSSKLRDKKNTLLPEALPAAPSLSPHRSPQLLKLKPRVDNNHVSLSPIITRSASPTQNGGRSWSSSPRSNRGQKNGRESPLSFSSGSSRPPPSPTPAAKPSSFMKSPSGSHRRSTSLNLTSSYSTFRRKHDDSKLSTLKEERQAAMDNEIPSMPINESSLLSVHRGGRAKTMPHGQHRRTVSFPNEVPQKNITGNNKHLYPYNDITSESESDDPALFSLIETTQTGRNGRVSIASDYDPLLASPVMSLHSVSEDSRDPVQNDRHNIPKNDHAKGKNHRRAKSAVSAQVVDKRYHRRAKSAASAQFGDKKKNHGGGSGSGQLNRSLDHEPSNSERECTKSQTNLPVQTISDQRKWKHSPKLDTIQNSFGTPLSAKTSKHSKHHLSNENRDGAQKQQKDEATVTDVSESENHRNRFSGDMSLQEEKASSRTRKGKWAKEHQCVIQ